MVEDTKVAAAYGEGGAEADSMSEAAGRGGPAATAAAKAVPDEAGPIGQGTTETDVKANLAEAAARAAAKGSR